MCIYVCVCLLSAQWMSWMFFCMSSTSFGHLNTSHLIQMFHIYVISGGNAAKAETILLTLKMSKHKPLIFTLTWSGCLTRKKQIIDWFQKYLLKTVNTLSIRTSKDEFLESLTILFGRAMLAEARVTFNFYN